MNNVKLIYKLIDDDYPAQVISFNTKKAAQITDRFLRETYGDDDVISRIIYDEDDMSIINKT